MILRLWLGFAVFLGVVVPSSRADPLVERIRADLAEGRDIVITSYVGLWSEHNDDPSRNLYWGALYGHDAMFDRPAEARRRLPFLTTFDYRTLSDEGRAGDPVVVKVLESATSAESAPERGSRVVVVYLVYRDMERAMYDMGVQAKTGGIPGSLDREGAVAEYLRRSYLVGYFGHNVYYAGSNPDRLEDVESDSREEPRGVFVVGCRTADWYPQKFLAQDVVPLLFTTTNMAPEAYVALALYDGIGRGLSRSEIRHNVARAYQVYQGLTRPPTGLFLFDEDVIREKAEPLR